MSSKAFENEFEFVNWLRGRASGRQSRLKLGIGDDAALVGAAHGRELILTTDLSIEGVHYSARLHPARSVGHRALARSLSDVAAMGGTPRYALVSLAMSTRTPRRWVEEFYAGLLGLAKDFGVTLIGGDTAVVPGPTTVDVVVCGEVPARRALRRSGARPGDHIFISGRLGLAALGLRLLGTRRQAARRVPSSSSRSAARGNDPVLAHLYPQPRCALGAYLARRGLPSAMIDVSDGLSSDLVHLCTASGVGAWIGEELIPTPDLPSTRAMQESKRLELALHGGEDYQLLFTVPRRKVRQLPRKFQGIPLRWIGVIWASKGVELLRADGTHRRLEAGGWDHFRDREK